MKRFGVVLGIVAVAGVGLLVYAARRSAPRTPVDAPVPLPAADGFRGFTLGSDTAPVEVVEYSDFECPYCAQFAVVQMPTVREQLIQAGKVRWRYRDFPLPGHRASRVASHAAHCAGEQGRFWEMHDQLFFNHSWAQTGKDPSRLFRDMARAVGLNLDAYDACMTSQRFAARIEASRREGEEVGVQGTPTFFVNGRRLTVGSYSSDTFKALAESLLAARR